MRSIALILDEFNKKQVAKLSEGKEIPEFRAGDTISVDINISEDAETVRLQNFTGLCIRKRRGGLHSSFLLRKVSPSGDSVERLFPLYSPTIVKMKVLKKGKVRRAKLYYMRNLFGKSSRLRERKDKPAVYVDPTASSTNMDDNMSQN